MAPLAWLLAYCLFTVGCAFVVGAWLDYRAQDWIILELDDDPPTRSANEQQEGMAPTTVADEVERWLRGRA
jgi:hypothetical protein